MTKSRNTSNRLSRALAVGIGFLVLSSAAPSARAEVFDRIVAVINDDIILLSDLQKEMRPYAEKLRSMGYPQQREQQMLTKLRQDLLEKLVDERLTDQQVQQQGISVSDEEVDNTIERIKEVRSLTDAELIDGLQSEGLTLEAYRRQLREQILRSKLLDYEIKSKIVITEEEIKAYYEDHLDEFGGETKYHLRTIIMRVPAFAGDERKEAVRRRMEEVHRLLEKGADFSALARRYSESSLAAEGGDLGLFNLQEMAPQFREAVEDLPEGGYTPILDTDQGFQIFYVEEIVTAAAKSLGEVSAEIQNRLYQQRVNERFSEWLEELRQRSHIKVIQ